jgi:hypothetical protein
MIINSTLLRDDEKVFFDWILKNTVSNEKQLESKKRKFARIGTNSFAFILGSIGNFLYYPYSLRLAKRFDAPMWIEMVSGNYFGICNGVTNGILTAIPLMEFTDNILRVKSKEENAIYKSEIPTFIRTFFNGSAFILSAGSQIPTAYLAYLPKKSLSRGFVLMFSNIGLTWKSIYEPMCSAYLIRRLSIHERKIELAKQAFYQHLQAIRNKLIIGDFDSIESLFEALSFYGFNDATSKTEALRQLYNFEIKKNTPTHEDLEKWFFLFEKLFIPIISYYLTFWLLSLYWYAGGNAGKDMVSSLRKSENSHDDINSENAAFYSLASFSVFCNSYLNFQYVHGTVSGIFLLLKDLYRGSSSPTISEILYPRATNAWKAFSVILTLGSWAFASEFILSDYPQDIQKVALSAAPVGVLALLGYGMLKITDSVVIKIMMPFSSNEIKKVIIANQKLSRLQEMTHIASHKVFAEHLKRVFELFDLEEKFGITTEEINAYFSSLSRGEIIPLLSEFNRNENLSSSSTASTLSAWESSIKPNIITTLTSRSTRKFNLKNCTIM